MQEFINSIGVLVIVAFIAFMVYVMYKKADVFGVKKGSDSEGGSRGLFPTRGTKNTGGDGRTLPNAAWTVHQISPKTGQPIKSAPVIITGDCFVIGRNSSSDFVIENADGDFDSVGNSHLGIGRDKAGYFAKDLKSLNGTFIGNSEEPQTDSFPLEDQQIIWLAGCCPIAFTRKKFQRNLVFNSAVTSTSDSDETPTIRRDAKTAAPADAEPATKGFHR